MERLSGLDASFLYVETETMHMHVAFVVICDSDEMPGGYSFRKVFDLMDSRTQREAPLRRRLVEIPFNINHPIWVDDPEFDIANHVFQERLTGTRCEGELGHRIGEMMSVPLDRSKPLWEARVFEGLENNRFAFVMKIHHSMVDGVSGTGLLSRLFDKEANQIEPKVIHRSKGERIPSKQELIAFALKSRAGRTKKFLGLVGESVEGVVSLVKNIDRKSEFIRSRPLLSAPKTHFNKRISSKRDVALAKISLSEVKAVKNATNTTVNDVVLGVCGGALREYLLTQDDLPEKSLLAMVPISVRKPDRQTVTNNQVSGMWSTLATQIDDPIERLRLIHNDTKGAKEDHDAVGADLIPDWAEFSNPGAMKFAIKLYASSGLADNAPVHNTIISNVPGSREPMYFAGAKVETIIPLGPVMEAVGLNISLASYEDNIGISVHVDSSLVKDVRGFAKLLEQSFADIKSAAGVKVKQKIKRKPATKKSETKKKGSTKIRSKKESVEKTKKKSPVKKTAEKKAVVQEVKPEPIEECAS